MPVCYIVLQPVTISESTPKAEAATDSALYGALKRSASDDVKPDSKRLRLDSEDA